jgi:peptidoglycan/LPS O-acetylase OafA/YrhL
VVCLVTYVFLGKQTWDLARSLEIIPCLARAAIGFLAGVVLYRAHHRGLLARLPSISPAIIFGIWFSICMIPETNRLPLFESVAAVIVAPLSVALLVRGERPLPKLYRELGVLSYPLYASHYAVIHLALIYWPPTTGHNLLFLLLLPASLLLAWGINRVAAMLPAMFRRPRVLAGT